MLKSDKWHHIVLLPAISDVSPSRGIGQLLTITGAGFGWNKKKIGVTVDNRKC